MVDAEQVQHGGVEIGPCNEIFDGFPADVVVSSGSVTPHS